MTNQVRRNVAASIVALIAVLAPTSTEARWNEMFTLEADAPTGSVDSDESPPRQPAMR